LPLVSIASLLPPLPCLKIVDVGAMPVSGPEPYELLVSAVPCEIVGFEPTPGVCEELNRTKGPRHKYLPHVVGDGSLRTFHETQSPVNSSLFEPNFAPLEKFHQMAPVFHVIRKSPVQTVRLDDIPETQGVDFLKVDVQGAELLVFSGARERLKDALVIHTEVEFAPLYKNQPLFADVDIFIRSQGFAFHKLSYYGSTFRPLIFYNNANVTVSQLLWGDAVYVRDFMDFESLSPEALLKLAVILHENYKSYDLAAVALGALDQKTGMRLQPEYLRRLMTA